MNMQELINGLTPEQTTQIHSSRLNGNQEATLYPKNDQVVFRFPNGYGASIVQGAYTYGGSKGLFDLGVIRWEGEHWKLVYDTPITDDVLGWQTAEDVYQRLVEIAQLPHRSNQVADKQSMG